MKRKKILLITALIALVSLCGFVYVRYFFVFATGTKAGTLNYFAKKGFVFKTYEGRLIQSGYRSKEAGSLQSNEFQFSVADEKVADELMKSSGKEVELHYVDYLRPLPWRGYSKFVVDSVTSVKDPPR